MFFHFFHYTNTINFSSIKFHKQKQQINSTKFILIIYVFLNQLNKEKNLETKQWRKNISNTNQKTPIEYKSITNQKIKKQVLLQSNTNRIQIEKTPNHHHRHTPNQKTPPSSSSSTPNHHSQPNHHRIQSNPATTSQIPTSLAADDEIPVDFVFRSMNQKTPNRKP